MSSGSHAVRVVLADDEDLVRDGLAAVLEADADIRVVGHADDGASLLELVEHQPCDVILVDVRMPGMDGLAALRRLPEPPPYRAVLTVFDLDDYVEQALRAGANGFLLKDCAPDALVRAVHDLAAGGAVIDPRIAARLLPRLRSLTTREPLDWLSEREREVLVLVGEGASNAEIGRRLQIAESTVKGHVTRLLDKLGVTNRVQAALLAKRLGDP